MLIKENTEILKPILKTLIDKIGRRTSEGFAVIIIETVLKDLEHKYPFIRFAAIENTSYSEGFDAVKIQSELNKIPSSEFFHFLKEFLEMTIVYLENNADFYFIKEFRESISDITDTDFSEHGINLNMMQHEYIVERKEELKIKKSEVLEHVTKTLVNLINRVHPEKQAIQTMIEVVQKNEGKYDFLKSLIISETPDQEGFYTIQANPSINGVRSAFFIEGIVFLIEDVCRLIRWKSSIPFIDAFKIDLGEEQVLNLKGLGINFSNIQTLIIRMEFEVLIKKSLTTIVDVLKQNHSDQYVYEALVTLQNKLQDTHEALRLITINPTFAVKGVDAITIQSEINTMEPYKVGKAIRDLIKYTCMWYLKGDFSFIEEFKEKLGDTYLAEIENIGVNLHFLELKFALK